MGIQVTAGYPPPLLTPPTPQIPSDTYQYPLREISLGHKSNSKLMPRSTKKEHQMEIHSKPKDGDKIRDTKQYNNHKRAGASIPRHARLPTSLPARVGDCPQDSPPPSGKIQGSIQKTYLRTRPPGSLGSWYLQALHQRLQGKNYPPSKTTTSPVKPLCSTPSF